MDVGMKIRPIRPLFIPAWFLSSGSQIWAEDNLSCHRVEAG